MGQAQPEKLTRREREVLALLGQGRTNKQIAGSLFVDVRTAEFHVANILGKLGLETRAQVAPYISRSGLENNQVGALYLPASLTSFVGREWEMATLCGLLQRSRLVTVAGPGGIGKTRLAIEAARIVHQPHTEGSWFVDTQSEGRPATPIRDHDELRRHAGETARLCHLDVFPNPHPQPRHWVSIKDGQAF